MSPNPYEVNDAFISESIKLDLFEIHHIHRRCIPQKPARVRTIAIQISVIDITDAPTNNPKYPPILPKIYKQYYWIAGYNGPSIGRIPLRGGHEPTPVSCGCQP